jgi:hypothetical protein
MSTSTYIKLIQLYKKYGYQVRTGLYPPHFFNFSGAAGTVLEKDDIKLLTGGGIGLDEVHFLDDLCEALSPQGVFVIGNTFGWSTFAFAFSQSSKVVALDAGIEGLDNMSGIKLTNYIAQQEKLKVQCVYGRSPDDVKTTILNNMIAPPTLVFIDGLHENTQLIKDFDSVLDTAPNATFLLHDIVNCNMQKAFNQISASVSQTHFTKILWRTFSGMGIVIPKERLANLETIIEAYTDDDGYIDTVRIRWRLLAMQERLGLFGKITNKLYQKMNRPLQLITNHLIGRKKSRRAP